MADGKKAPVELVTDVLVIGGGSAGLWCADHIKELAPELSVTIVDKGPRNWGGLMAESGGDLVSLLPGDDIDAWMRDFIYYWDGLCDQELLERFLRKSYDILKEYADNGCDFLTDEDGAFRSVVQRGLDHPALHPARRKGCGGERMAQVKLRQMRERGVRFQGRTLVTDLLKRGDRVIGAVGFDTIRGDFYLFRSRVVVMACGNSGWKTSQHASTVTGEGVALAVRAGASVRNYEFVKVWNVPDQFSWEGQTTLMPLGAKYVNSRGEAFMDRYSPVLGANTDPHYLTRGMAFELHAGRGPIHFDMSAIPERDRPLIRPEEGNQLLHYTKLVDVGMDFFRDDIHWRLQMLDSQGGLTADSDGRTGVPGLYAAGRCRSIDNGVYMGGFALFSTAVGGWFAGEAIVRELREDPPELESPSAAQVEELRAGIFRPLGREGWTPKEVLTRIQSLVFPYDVCILKSEASLSRALEGVRAIRAEQVPRMAAADPHYLLKLWEVDAIAETTEWYLLASLARRESRAGHFRLDYPARDDASFLGWLELSPDGAGGMDVHLVPVPLEQYRFPVERYYSDQFRFPTSQTV